MITEKLHILDRSVFISEDILGLAKFLLGKYIVSSIEGRLCVVKIVETEAYKAPEDKGSHAYQNKRTKRTEVMFQKGGLAYIYLCYGLHKMLNVVTGPEGIAHAILIRAVEPVYGIEHIIERRNMPHSKALSNGPGKLCSALGIEMHHNGIDLSLKSGPLYLAENKEVKPEDIIEGPRVGIAYAEECAHWLWRFRIKNNGWTSPPAIVRYS